MNPAAKTDPPHHSAEAIAAMLSDRQHLQPRSSVQSALDWLVQSEGICAQAIAQSIAWLKIDPAQAIGRLKQAQIAQLARCMHRFWSQALGVHMLS